MTRFWWVRHGPTHAKTFVGWRDVPADLSDTAKVARVQAALPTTALIVSSDLSRCAATAEALKDTRRTLPSEPGLREFNFGAWDGLSFDQVSARDPDLSREFWDQAGDIQAPLGESWNEVSGRVAAVVERLAAQRAYTDIICVAHFGVILTQIALCKGRTTETALAQKIEPLSVTRIDWSPDRADLIFANHEP